MSNNITDMIEQPAPEVVKTVRKPKSERGSSAIRAKKAPPTIVIPDISEPVEVKADIPVQPAEEEKPRKKIGRPKSTDPPKPKPKSERGPGRPRTVPLQDHIDKIEASTARLRKQIAEHDAKVAMLKAKQTATS